MLQSVVTRISLVMILHWAFLAQGIDGDCDLFEGGFGSCRHVGKGRTQLNIIVNQFASMVDRIDGTHGYWKQHPALQIIGCSCSECHKLL